MASAFKKFAKSFEDGRIAESRFQQIALKMGISCQIKSDAVSQFKNHIDAIINHKGLSAAVDIKSMKRVSRDSDAPDEDVIWLEFQNVNGNEGWLNGCADYIAFERADGFHLVNRIDLKGWAYENVDFKLPARSSSEAYKRIYNRKGRSDLISRVSFSDIQHLVRIVLTETPKSAIIAE